MLDIVLSKAINTFAPEESPAFEAFPDVSLPENRARDDAEPYVAIKVTSGDDEGRTSELTNMLTVFYADVHISARTPAQIAAVRRSILSRQGEKLGAEGEQVQWLYVDDTNTTAVGDARRSAILELQVFHNENLA